MSNNWNNGDYSNWGKQPERNKKPAHPFMIWLGIIAGIFTLGICSYLIKNGSEKQNYVLGIQSDNQNKTIYELEQEIRDIENELRKVNEKQPNRTLEAENLALSDDVEYAPPSDEQSENIDEGTKNNQEDMGKNDAIPNPHLSPADVKNVIRNSASDIRDCARRSAKKGKMNVAFIINADGTVSNAKSKSPEFDKDTEECVLNVVSSLQFPPNQGKIPVVFPFLIQ